MLISRLGAGYVSDRFGRRKVVAPAFILVASSLLMLMYTYSIVMLVIAGFVFGVGFGAVQPTLLAMGADRSAPGLRGVVMAMVGGGMDFGWGLGSVVSGVVLQFAGFDALYLMNIASALMGFALVLRNSRSSIQRHPVAA